MSDSSTPGPGQIVRCTWYETEGTSEGLGYIARDGHWMKWSQRNETWYAVNYPVRWDYLEEP